jgi:hypothetical protein
MLFVKPPIKKIPNPKTSNWKTVYGDWKGFVKAVHKSIGRNLGNGIVNNK